MNSHRRLSMICIFVFCAVQFLTAMAPQSSNRVTMGDSAPPPPTLADAWRDASAVIYGKVTRIIPPRVGGSASKPTVSRSYDVQVIEVLKQDASSPLSVTIEVFHFGGTVEVDGKLVASESSIKPFARNDELVLFLKRRADPNTYAIAYGANGIFRVDVPRGTAQVPTGMQKYGAFGTGPTTSVQDLLGRLRAMKR